MSVQALIGPAGPLSRALDMLQAPLALAARVYVSWVFLKSGYLKISN